MIVFHKKTADIIAICLSILVLVIDLGTLLDQNSKYVWKWQLLSINHEICLSNMSLPYLHFFNFVLQRTKSNRRNKGLEEFFVVWSWWVREDLEWEIFFVWAGDSVIV